MMIPTHPSTPVLSIPESAQRIALGFAQQQPTREKAKQVYRNTLAVLAVKHCLDLLEIPTDLAASESWNPFSRMAANVADLQITGLGRLECRPVSPDEQCCSVPPEVWENRIGCVVVQFDPSYREATLLGFAAIAIRSTVPKGIAQSLPLNQLQPLEELFIQLDLLSAPSWEGSGMQRSLHHLSQWFNAMTDTRESGWQAVETLLGLPQPAFAFRSFHNLVLDTPEQIQQLVEQLYASQRFAQPRSDAFPLPPDADFKAALVHLIQTTTDEETRWKAAEILWAIDPSNPMSGMRRVLDLGLLLVRQPLALMVSILQPSVGAAPGSDSDLSILVRVYPMAEQGYLPTGLQLAILDGDGSLGLETQSRERDNYIQLKLKGKFGEQFSIRLCLEDDVITEYFVI
jgi:hypothetical protein